MFWRVGFSVRCEVALVRYSPMFLKVECLRTEDQAVEDAVYHQQRHSNNAIFYIFAKHRVTCSRFQTQKLEQTSYLKFRLLSHQKHLSSVLQRPTNQCFQHNNCLLRVTQNTQLHREGKWQNSIKREMVHTVPSPHIFRVIKSRRMRWAGHVARMGERRGIYRVLVGKPEGK